MRLDKFLCEFNIGSRSQVKTYLKKGLVTVNGTSVTKPELKIDEYKDCISFNGKPLQYQPFIYYMLNKPKDVVSATVDNSSKTVLDLIVSHRKKDLFPVGRLDKDTEGLLLITNDGELAHQLLSPRKHVDKTYLVGIAKELLPAHINALEQGVDIGEEKLTLPAKVKVLSKNFIELTIQEGKFHQVKRMLHAVDNEVVSLKRVRFGPLILDESLAPGAYRELTKKEVAQLHERKQI